MSFNHTLSAILRGRWMIQPQWAEAHLPLVLSMLKGNPVSFVERNGAGQFEMPYLIDPKTGNQSNMYTFDWRTERYGLNTNIAPNSVAVIPISGPITKYDGDCGEAGMIKRNNWMQAVARTSNIGSAVLLLDTPGGEARATETFSASIKNAGKPVLSYVDGMAASAGVFYTSSSTEVYLSSDNSEIGSVGVYITLMDFKGWFEEQGVKVHEIYAPQSVDKNKDYRDALAGDYTLITEDLKRFADGFINHVKTNRPAAAANESMWNTGKMFYGKDAVKAGLADGIMPLANVIGKAAWLGARNKNS